MAPPADPAEAGPSAAALAVDVAARIGRVQGLMAAHDLDALLIGGSGSPDGTACVRYVSNARAWAGPLYAVLARDDADPWVLSHSPYQATWARAATTARPERVMAPPDLMAHIAALLRCCLGPRRRIGIAGRGKIALAEHEALAAVLADCTLVDLSAPFDALRRRKSSFEIAAFRHNGALLAAAMRVFAAHAAVGTRYAAAAAAAEAFLKGEGAFWTRAKLSFGSSPFTVPPDAARRVAAGDAFTFELVAESPWGYWTEMTTHYAVGDFPDEMARLATDYLAAFEAARASARPGLRQGEIAAVTDATLAARGWPVAGKHTPDCHSIGLDGADAPGALAAPDLVLEPDMVLSLHPGTLLAGERALLVSDNVLVTPAGGVRLSPHGAAERMVRLPA